MEIEPPDEHRNVHSTRTSRAHRDHALVNDLAKTYSARRFQLAPSIRVRFTRARGEISPARPVVVEIYAPCEESRFEKFLVKTNIRARFREIRADSAINRPLSFSLARSLVRSPSSLGSYFEIEIVPSVRKFSARARLSIFPLPLSFLFHPM